MSRESLLSAVPVEAGNRSLLRRLNSHGVLSRIRQEPQTVSQLANVTVIEDRQQGSNAAYLVLVRQ